MKLIFTISTIAVIALASSTMSAQSMQRVTADTVLRFIPGSGQNTGQGPAFYPSNIFGVPDPTATETAPSVDPREICSIGLDGEIIVGFADYVIVDEEGPDFTVYENAFLWGPEKYYREPARIEVSSDGETWTPFPFDSLSLDGCAGKTPTSGLDPFDPLVGGGDSFDLSDIGADSIRWIKIVDVSRIILDNTSHPDYDPTLTGFDLDAVVTSHASRFVEETSITLIPRTASVLLEVDTESALFKVYDVAGTLLRSERLARGVHVRDLSGLVVTCAFGILQSGDRLYPVKVLR